VIGRDQFGEIGISGSILLKIVNLRVVIDSEAVDWMGTAIGPFVIPVMNIWSFKLRRSKVLFVKIFWKMPLCEDEM
jgi:hypothetical protein